MKPIVTSRQMRAIEEAGVKLGISKILMMENAGSSVANYVFNKISSPLRENGSVKKKKRVLLIAGTGNNGGDVFVAARHLAYWSDVLSLTVVLLGREGDIRAYEAQTNWRILQRLRRIRKIVISRIKGLSILKRQLQKSRIVVVGIFGTGFNGAPRQLQRRAIEMINAQQKALKVSVDIPSGMDADSGRSTFSVESDVTITMHAWKKGMAAKGSGSKTGKVVVANIGLPG